MQKIMAASAAAPGISHIKAVEAIAAGITDPVLGTIGYDHVQLCPQHSGKLSMDSIEILMDKYPSTSFRIHATPRVAGDHTHHIVDAANAHEYPEQIQATANLSKRLNAKGYTLHAGLRNNANLAQAFDNTKRLADIFQCRVGIEGLYPSLGRTSKWLLSSWAEHEELLKSGVDFAIDLSHLGIVAKRERQQRHDLVEALLSSDHCIECHVSDNDARTDSHRPLTAGSPPWWLPFLVHVNPEAVTFYEGIAIDPRRKRETLSN